MDTLVLAYILIALGLLLIVADLFFFSVVLFVLGLVAIIVGQVLVLGHDYHTGMVTLIVTFVVLPVLASVALRLGPRTALGRRLFLAGPTEDDTLATMPVNLELEALRGRYGKTVSALRPSGTTEFDGRRIDTMSEGGMIEPGQWVRCIDVKAGRVIVRAVDGPPDLANMDTMQFG
jgi:membrane-bound serine protease (ClpP class)